MELESITFPDGTRGPPHLSKVGFDGMQPTVEMALAHHLVYAAFSNREYIIC
jgi:hypothetical protein